MNLAEDGAARIFVNHRASLSVPVSLWGPHGGWGPLLSGPKK